MISDDYNKQKKVFVCYGSMYYENTDCIPIFVLPGNLGAVEEIVGDNFVVTTFCAIYFFPYRFSCH